jgi:hypothetical protein
MPAPALQSQHRLLALPALAGTRPIRLQPRRLLDPLGAVARRQVVGHPTGHSAGRAERAGYLFHLRMTLNVKRSLERVMQQSAPHRVLAEHLADAEQGRVDGIATQRGDVPYRRRAASTNGSTVPSRSRFLGAFGLVSDSGQSAIRFSR